MTIQWGKYLKNQSVSLLLSLLLNVKTVTLLEISPLQPTSD